MCDSVKHGPVGYMFADEVYCMSCIGEIALLRIRKTIVGAGFPADGECSGTECLLDYWASVMGITNRRNESGFDSDDFPKSVLYHDACQLICEDTSCDADGCECHHELCSNLDCMADICD